MFSSVFFVQKLSQLSRMIEPQLIVISTVCVCLVVCERTCVMKGQMLKEVTGGGSYDRKAHPTYNQGYPTNITISMYIEGMSSFRATTMDFQLDVYFQQQWTDHRLNHSCDKNVLVKDNDLLQLLWLPDLYFANAKVANFHHVTARNFLMWIKQDGTVFYDTRISLVVMCMMNLAKWPLDEQKCRLRIMSYAYDTEQLTIKWTSMGAIVMNEDILMPDMKLVSAKTGLCNGNYSTGVWSCVNVEFHVRRQIMHHITQTYIPSALIVVISWFSFWLDIDAVPARVSLSITTLLTLSTQANAARMSLPEVSYMKAIDVWMGMCLAFVFLAMIEFTAANFVQRQGERKYAKSVSKSDKAADRQAARFALTTASELVVGNDHSTKECNEQLFSPIVIQPQTDRRLLELGNGYGGGGHRFHSMRADTASDTELATLDMNRRLSIFSTTPLVHRHVMKRRTSKLAAKVIRDRWSSWRGPGPDRQMQNQRQGRKAGRLAAQRIDLVSRYLFPITFLVFNLVYWPYYIFSPEHF